MRPTLPEGLAGIAVQIGTGSPVGPLVSGLTDAELVELRGALAHRVHRVAVSAVLDARAAKAKAPKPSASTASLAGGE
jgi:hypothetical protein